MFIFFHRVLALFYILSYYSYEFHLFFFAVLLHLDLGVVNEHFHIVLFVKLMEKVLAVELQCIFEVGVDKLR